MSRSKSTATSPTPGTKDNRSNEVAKLLETFAEYAEPMQAFGYQIAGAELPRTQVQCALARR